MELSDGELRLMVSDDKDDPARLFESMLNVSANKLGQPLLSITISDAQGRRMPDSWADYEFVNSSHDVRKIIQNSCAQHVELAISHLDDDGLVSFCRALCDVQPMLDSLSITTCGGYDSTVYGQAGADAIANLIQVHPSIRSLHFDNVTFETHWSTIFDAIKVNNTLTDLHVNEISGYGGLSLAAALESNTALTKIHVTSCYLLDDDDQVALAHSLMINSSLTDVSLTARCFNIGLLGDAVTVNSTITNMRLWVDADAPQLQTFLSAFSCNVSITSMDLYGIYTNDALEREKRARNMAQYLSHALKYNSSIKSLAVSFNSIADDGVWTMSNALKINTSLTTLDLSHNSISSFGLFLLLDMLKVNTSLDTIDMTSNPIHGVGQIKHLHKRLLISHLEAGNRSEYENDDSECPRFANTVLDSDEIPQQFSNKSQRAQENYICFESPWCNFSTAHVTACIVGVESVLVR